jgi:hypothetical protein
MDKQDRSELIDRIIFFLTVIVIIRIARLQQRESELVFHPGGNCPGHTVGMPGPECFREL